MKFFVDPTLYPDAEGAARRAAAQFRHRFGIGPDVLNERFPRAERDGIVAFLQGHADAPPATSTPEQGSSSARSTPAATPIVEHARLDQPPANDTVDAVEASFEEVLEIKPEDVVMVASLGVEGVVVAVTGTTATVALDGVTDEFDVSDLAPPAAQVADASPAAPEAALAPSSPEQAVGPPPTVGV